MADQENKAYEAPTMEVILFEQEDVICTSGLEFPMPDTDVNAGELFGPDGN